MVVDEKMSSKQLYILKAFLGKLFKNENFPYVTFNKNKGVLMKELYYINPSNIIFLTESCFEDVKQMFTNVKKTNLSNLVDFNKNLFRSF